MPSTTPLTSASVPVSPNPSPEATATARGVEPPPIGLLPPGSFAEIVVGGLRLRQAPAGQDGFDRIVATLAAGDTLFVLDSSLARTAPTHSPDGRGWYSVEVLTRADDPSLAHDGGSVAEGEGGLEYLAPLPALCPGPNPILADLLRTDAGVVAQQLGAWDRLACLGDTGLQLEGMIDWTCNEGGFYPFTLEPGWLAAETCTGLAEPDPADASYQNPALPLRFDPALVYPDYERGDLVQLRGHFDDEAAAHCRVATPGDWPVDPAFLRLFCRERLVVEDMTITGHYELPPLY